VAYLKHGHEVPNVLGGAMHYVADTAVGDEALQVTRQLVNIKLGDREQQEPGVLRACSRIP
jgi:hypothetical protein